MVAIGSPIASPTQPGRLDFVTSVDIVGEDASGKIAFVRSQHVERGNARSVNGTEQLTSSAAPPSPTTKTGPAYPVRPDSLIAAQGSPSPPSADAGAGSGAAGDGHITAAEQRIVDRLSQRDGAVRQEEQAHAAAAGQAAGAPQYSFVTGPDGRQYAVSGRVNIKSVNTSGRPEDAERALNVIANAALAAHAPSAQDLSAARTASQDAGAVADAAYRALLDPDSRGSGLDLEG